MEDQSPLKADGTMSDTSLYFGGEMGRRAVAWLLPSNYEPQ